MINVLEDLEKLSKLPENKSCTLNWFEEGGGVVYNCNGVYVVFEVSQYGSSECYMGTYLKNEQSKLLTMVYSWK